VNNLIDIDAAPTMSAPARRGRSFVLPLILFALFAAVPLLAMYGQ
jgi:branched-chain amino acid transport system permease protein